MACGCNKISKDVNQSLDPKFEKLSLDNPNKTVIMAGYNKFTVQQLENEIDSNSEVGRKLKSVEAELDKY